MMADPTPSWEDEDDDDGGGSGYPLYECVGGPLDGELAARPGARKLVRFYRPARMTRRGDRIEAPVHTYRLRWARALDPEWAPDLEGPVWSHAHEEIQEVTRDMEPL